MKIRITGKGIYGGDGPVAVGTEVSLKAAPPAEWAGKYEVIEDAPKGELTAAKPRARKS